MEKIIMNKWTENKNKLKTIFSKHKKREYEEYNSLIKLVIHTILPNSRLINYKEVGTYSGDIYFTISYKSNYYFGSIGYGSCSVCDSLIHAIGYHTDIKPNKKEIEDLMLLSLELLESLHKGE